MMYKNGDIKLRPENSAWFMNDEIDWEKDEGKWGIITFKDHHDGDIIATIYRDRFDSQESAIKAASVLRKKHDYLYNPRVFQFPLNEFTVKCHHCKGSGYITFDLRNAHLDQSYSEEDIEYMEKNYL